MAELVRDASGGRELARRRLTPCARPSCACSRRCRIAARCSASVRAHSLTAWGGATRSLRLRLIMRQFLRAIASCASGPQAKARRCGLLMSGLRLRDRRHFRRASPRTAGDAAQCDTLHVADATNDATIRPGHCVLRKRPTNQTPPRKRFSRPDIPAGNAVCWRRPAPPPRHFLLAPGPVSPAREPAAGRQPGGRQPESAAHRPHACNAAPRSSRSKAGLPPPATGFPPPAFGPQSFRASRPRSESCRSRMLAASRAYRRLGPAATSGPLTGAAHGAPPPAATCCRSPPLEDAELEAVFQGYIAGVSGLPTWFVRAGRRPAEPPRPTRPGASWTSGHRPRTPLLP